MTDYEVFNPKIKDVIKTLRNVERIEAIPMGCKRVFFKKGSCKVKACHELRVEEKRKSAEKKEGE